MDLILKDLPLSLHSFFGPCKGQLFRLITPEMFDGRDGLAAISASFLSQDESVVWKHDFRKRGLQHASRINLIFHVVFFLVVKSFVSSQFTVVRHSSSGG